MKKLRWLKRLGFAAVVLVTLLALAVAFENYRGKRAWQAFKTEWEARGERFDIEAFRPPQVPDDQNFAMTPLLAPLHDYRIDPQTRMPVWKDTNASERPKKLFGWQPRSREVAAWRVGEFSDLKSWQRELRDQTNSPNPQLQALLATTPGKPEADLLFLLSLNAAELDEIRSASRRPYAAFKIHVEEAFNALFPELEVMKKFAGVFQTKALAELASGNTDAAFEDLQASLKMSEAIRSEPILISGLVRIACLELAVPPLYEGLARHQWSASQLEHLQAQLSQINLVEEMSRTLRGERAFAIAIIDLMKRDPASLDMDDQSAFGSLRYMPSGWFYQNQLNLSRFYQETFPCLDTSRRVVDLAKLDRVMGDLDQQMSPRRPYTVFVSMLFPAIHKAIDRTARAQATLDLAVVACALERRRLSTGQYPDRLDALTPGFLERVPLDPVNGEPLKYRRTDDSRFVLWSVGLNLKDDGGTFATQKQGKPAPDLKEGDWVWQYPKP